MSYSNRQVADVQPGKGFTVAESNEHQRNWDRERWDRGAQEGNYDPSRAHLNFEVAKGGKVRPIDTSRSIPQRFQERLEELGIEDPNKGLDTPRFRTVAKFIFGGSRERMHQLAFGGTDIVDLAKGADNSRVQRSRDIENWARDIYSFVADRYGEDNIIGFYCHLDEVNPHIHCSVIPVTPEGRLSFKKVFKGDSLVGYRENMVQLHSELARVNARYGLERGTNVRVSGARHVSTEEYRRQLAEECHTLEEQIAGSRLVLKSLSEDISRATRKVKGLSTMIGNLKKEKEALLLQVSDLRHQAMTEGMDAEDVQRRIEALEREIALTDEKLADKEGKLEAAEKELAELNAELEKGTAKQEELLSLRRAVTSDMMEQAQMRMSHAVLPMLLGEFRSMIPFMNAGALQHMDDSLLKDMMTDGDSLFEKAVRLFVGFADQATMVAEGGGGGTSSDLPWGRDEDEDERAWARRCMQKARSMMRRTGGGRKR